MSDSPNTPLQESAGRDDRPVAVAYTLRQPGARVPRWLRSVPLLVPGLLALGMVLGCARSHNYINPAREYCTKCLALSRITHREILGCKFDGARTMIDTPVSKVIQECEGHACTHEWLIYDGAPQTLCGQYWVIDYFPPYWLLTLEADEDGLAPLLRQRLQRDPGFLPALRAALPDRRKAGEALEALKAWAPPPL